MNNDEIRRWTVVIVVAVTATRSCVWHYPLKSIVLLVQSNKPFHCHYLKEPSLPGLARHRLGLRDGRLHWASPRIDVTTSIMATTCRISQLPPLSHTNHSATVIIITCKAPPRPRTGGLGSHRRPYVPPPPPGPKMAGPFGRRGTGMGGYTGVSHWTHNVWCLPPFPSPGHTSRGWWLRRADD